MKLFIVARNKRVIPAYRKRILKKGFGYGKENPDMILSLGGDGTYLIAEHDFPEIPKILVRDSNICNKCSISLFDEILKQLKDKNKYKTDEWLKIEGIYKSQTLVATNDIIVRNRDQRQAIRFRIKVNNIPFQREFIGDGVIFSTPWGSTGYFKSITKRDFKKGIGVALNNINANRREIIVKENARIDLEITRGDAVLSSDNAKREFVLKTGDRLTIKRHRKPAKTVTIKK